jgi:hypothetical protein
MKKLNNQYKAISITTIFWHHLLQWLRLLVLALARSREWMPQMAVVRQAQHINHTNNFFNTKTY